MISNARVRTHRYDKKRHAQQQHMRGRKTHAQQEKTREARKEPRGKKRHLGNRSECTRTSAHITTRTQMRVISRLRQRVLALRSG